MASKTKEVDALLRRILSAICSGNPVSIEDSDSLNTLYQDYLESTDENLSKSLGLRRRVKECEKVDSFKEFDIFLISCLKQQLQESDEILSYISLYLDKKIPIAKLFGERIRKDRNSIGCLAEGFMADVAAKTWEHILTSDGKKLVTGNESLGLPGTLFQLLADLSSDKEIDEISKTHSLEVSPELRNLKATLDAEKEFVELPKSASRWREAYKCR